MVRSVKGGTSGSRRGTVAQNDGAGTSDSGPETETVTERRVLRSRYLAVKNLISDKRDDISRFDSDKFKSIINEVESLHQLVQKPREQVADAETLWDITNTLITSVRAHSNEGITPSDFVSCLLRDFGQQSGTSSSMMVAGSAIHWKDIGLAVSHVFRRGTGCCTMLGPMNTELKQRKAIVRRQRVKPLESSKPEEIDIAAREEKTDTDKNMATMFGILKNNRRVCLEKLVLNRNSFAQTIENIFTLSFLVKDGRAEIMVDEKGSQLVSPRNAPAAHAVVSGEVSYSHFAFRFDYRDWKAMILSVGVGEELMPHRNQVDTSHTSETGTIPEETQAAAPTTPIRKLSRNRGLVLQEQMIVENSPESDDPATRAAATQKRKRKL